MTIGIALAYYLSGEKGTFKNIIDIFVTIPIVFPPIALGFLLLVLLGKNGIIGESLHSAGIEVIFTEGGVILASFIAGLPFIVKPVHSAIDEQSKIYSEASYVLGKGRFETLFFVILPNIKKVIVAGLFLALGRSIGEVGITLMLGGNVVGKTDTISLAIYNAAFGGDTEIAIVLSILLALFSIIIFIILKKIAYF